MAANAEALYPFRQLRETKWNTESGDVVYTPDLGDSDIDNSSEIDCFFFHLPLLSLVNASSFLLYSACLMCYCTYLHQPHPRMMNQLHVKMYSARCSHVTRIAQVLEVRSCVLNIHTQIRLVSRCQPLGGDGFHFGSPLHR
jgi:hypothetical protein